MRTLYEAAQMGQAALDSGLNPYGRDPYLSPSDLWVNRAVAPVNTELNLDAYTNPTPFGYQSYAAAAPAFQAYQGQAPSYQGLAGGDYGRLETALRTPGENAAKTAYQAAKRDLDEAMGGRGLYGSSIYGRQMSDNLGAGYMRSLADNSSQAAAKRYGMEQADKQFASNLDYQVYSRAMQDNELANQYALDAWKAKLGENMAANQLASQNRLADAQLGFQAAQAGASWRDTMNNRQGNFANAVSQDFQAYKEREAAWNNQQKMQAMAIIEKIFGEADPLQDRILKKQGDLLDAQASGGSGLGSILGGATSMIGKAITTFGPMLAMAG